MSKNSESNSKETSAVAAATTKIRVPGADEPKNALEVFKTQFENFRNLGKVKRVPKQCEVLIIGGGIIGSFVAYWVKTLAPNLNVTVIEKDNSYIKSSSYWSIGGVRQQFSLPENIKMSMFGAEFLQNVQEHLKCEEKSDPVDVHFNHDGYLFLASKKTADLLYQNHKVQLANNAKVCLYNKEELQSVFKYLNTDDIELGSFGYQNEGWVDPRKLLLAVRAKATYLGAEFVDGEVVKIETNNGAQEVGGSGVLSTAVVDTFDNKLVPIKFQTCVNAAGPWASQVAKLAGIGADAVEESPLSVPLPVEARKRYIYMFYADKGPILKVPLTIDHSGVWWRRQGLSNYYFCGRNQAEGEEPEDLDLEKVDLEYFEKKIKPVLTSRVPSFSGLKLVNSFAGYYEYNTLDQNLIIGRHPVRSNFIFTNGSSGHGFQHSAAIGKSVAELIVYDEYKTIDLKRFGFQRVLRNQPVKEIDVV